MKQFYKSGQNIGATKYYYLTDHLQSIRQLTDNSANVQGSSKFDPFGRIVESYGSVAADFGFCQYYFHERSYLNVMLFRAYSANLARFFSFDPLERISYQRLFDLDYSHTNSDFENPYAYTRNNPISFKDESGLLSAPIICPTDPCADKNSWKCNCWQACTNVAKGDKDKFNDCIDWCYKKYGPNNPPPPPPPPEHDMRGPFQGPEQLVPPQNKPPQDA